VIVFHYIPLGLKWRYLIIKKINPIKLDGIWTEGYALDKHTISSEFLGTDEYGHNQFNTIRSDIGQLLYELKYKANIEKVVEIISLIKPFLLKWGIANKIDIILPDTFFKER